MIAQMNVMKEASTEDTSSGNFNAVKSFGVELMEALAPESPEGAAFSLV